MLQTNQEASIRAIPRGLATYTVLSMRQPPAYSSDSQGSIERKHATLWQEVRAARKSVKDSYGGFGNKAYHDVTSSQMVRPRTNNDGVGPTTARSARWQRHCSAAQCGTIYPRPSETGTTASGWGHAFEATHPTSAPRKQSSGRRSGLCPKTSATRSTTSRNRLVPHDNLAARQKTALSLCCLILLPASPQCHTHQHDEA